MSGIDPNLLKKLACPACHGRLDVVIDQSRDDDELWLMCTTGDCRKRYPVRNGIPFLLADEARDEDPES